MCVTTREALLQDTYLLVADLPNGSRTLIYQNEAETQTINAMVLPIDTDKIAPSDLKALPSAYLSDIYDILKGQRYGFGRGGFEAVISTKCGSYDVHIVNQLDENAFMAINALGVGMKRCLYDWYNQKYPDFCFVFCVFDEKSPSPQKHPIQINYQARNTEWLHFPLVDSHTGDIPSSDFIKPHQICLCQDNYQKYTHFIDDMGINVNHIPLHFLKTNNEDMWVKVGAENVYDIKEKYKKKDIQFCFR